MMAKKNTGKTFNKHKQLYIDRARREGERDTSFGDALNLALNAKDVGKNIKSGGEKKKKKPKSGINKNAKVFDKPTLKVEKSNIVNSGKSGGFDNEKIIERLQNVIWDAGDRKNPKVAKEVFDILNSYAHKKNKNADEYMSDLNRILSDKHTDTTGKIFHDVFGSDEKETVLKKWRDNKNGEREKYKKLSKNSAKKDKDKLYAVIKRLYNKELVFHGEKTGNGGLRKKTDIDGQASEFLLKLCGFFKDSKGNNIVANKTFVSNGEVGSKGMQFDSGGTATGFKAKESESGSLFNSTVILDEHSDDSELAEKKKRPTSTTHIVFDMLKRLGQVPSKHIKQIQRFVDFVDIIESNYYVVAGVDFENSHRTIAGLYRNLPVEFIYNYFSDPKRTGFELLSDKFLSSKSNMVKNHYNYINGKKEDVLLKDISDYKLSRNEKAKVEYKELDKKNYFLKFNDSSFVVDVGGKITDCQQVAAYNYRGSFRIFPSGDIYLYSIEGLPKKLGKYKTKEGHFLIKNMSKDDLMDLIDDNFEFSSALKPEDKEGLLNSIFDLYAKLENDKKLKEKSEKSKKINNMIKNIVKHNIKNKISYTNEKGTKIEGSILTKDVIGGKLEDGYIKIKLNNNKTFVVQRRVLKSNDTLELEYLDYNKSASKGKVNSVGRHIGPKLKKIANKHTKSKIEKKQNNN